VENAGFSSHASRVLPLKTWEYFEILLFLKGQEKSLKISSFQQGAKDSMESYPGYKKVWSQFSQIPVYFVFLFWCFIILVFGKLF
jgi:hypothetical protein